MGDHMYVTGTYLRLDQDQVNEEDNVIMLDILVGKTFTIRTLGQAHTFSKRAIIGPAVGSV